MKICILTHNLDVKNGGGRFSYELITKLKKLDKDLEIKVLTAVNSGHKLEKTILYPNKIKLFFSLLKIRKVIKQYDIIHALDGWPYGVIAVLASIGLSKKIIITAVGSGSIQPLYSFWTSPILKWSYHCADKLTTISSYTAREVIKKVSDLKIKAIPLGIDYNYFLDKIQQINKNNQEINNIKPYILSVGKIKPRKGYHISLEVFAKVSQQISDLRYVIVGSGKGEYFEKLRKIINDLEIDKKVIFQQNISDYELASFYQGAELFLLLPQNIDYDVEGFGLVYLEAAAFGLPVVGGLNSGAEDAIMDKQNGFLVDAKNINETADLIIKILNDQKLREKLGEESIKFAKKMNWQEVARQYLNIYKTL